MAAHGKNAATEYGIGDLIKASSGRTYRVEKVLKSGQLKGREQKKGADELTGPTRTFRAENVALVRGGSAPSKKKAARKRVKPGEDLPKDRAKTGASYKANEHRAKKSGCLEAAISVLAESGEPMGCKFLMDTIIEKGLWSTQGATPHQTLSSAIQREIAKKGKESRFVKTARGLFTVNAKVVQTQAV